MRYCFATALIFTICAPTFGQTLQESISAYEDSVDVAKQKVMAKYQAEIIDATKRDDFALAEKIRQATQRFDSQGIMVNPSVIDMAETYIEYGKSLKTAGDGLRDAYLSEIEKHSNQGDFEIANSLLSELNDQRLPTDLISLQEFQGNEYFNHWGLQLRANVPKTSGQRMNATFELTAGLSEPTFTSIRSLNWPTHFVDHFGFRVRLAPFQDDLSWRRHASWIKTEGLASGRGISFKSVSHPDRYIRIRQNGEAWLDVYENTRLFKQQATFFKKKPLFRMW